MFCAAVIFFALNRFVWTPAAILKIPTGNSSLAVLPFENRSNLADDAYFVDGMHDDLLTMLAKIKTFSLTSRTSVMRYRGSN